MRFGIALLVLAAIVQVTYGDEVKAEKEVLQILRDYESSVNNPDAMLWRSIWDLDYEGLTIIENDRPRPLGKSYVEEIAEWMRTAKPEKRQTWHTNQVVQLEPDLAYTVSLRTEHKKPEKERESRISMVMRRSNGKWKIIHCHFSLVPRDHPLAENVRARGMAFRYDGRPSFSITVPAGSQRIQTDAPDQVFAARTKEGVTFSAAVNDAWPESALGQWAQTYADTIVSQGIARNPKITVNTETTLACGTRAYRSEIQWLHIPSGSRLLTQAMAAFKDGETVFVTAHPIANPETVIPIVESLQFGDEISSKATPPLATIPNTAVHILRDSDLSPDFRIEVALPDDYYASGRRYPVIYLTDGDGNFAPVTGNMRALGRELPPAILVGIAYHWGNFQPVGSVRTRDLTPTYDEEWVKEVGWIPTTHRRRH